MHGLPLPLCTYRDNPQRALPRVSLANCVPRAILQDGYPILAGTTMREWLPILRIALELAVLLWERRQEQKDGNKNAGRCDNQSALRPGDEVEHDQDIPAFTD